MEQTTVSAGHPEEQTSVDPVEPPLSKRRRLRNWISGGVIALGILLLKLKTVLFLVAAKFKLLLVNPFEGFGVAQIAMAAGSMLVSLAAYAKKWGLSFAAGFLLILVLHEVGHAVMIRVKGLRAGAMVFIPFIGGAVTLKRQPRSAFIDAQIALAGPIAGAVASVVSLGLYRTTGMVLFLIVAHAGFLINLFNLTPIGPLDGGRIAAAITKWMWIFGGVILLLLTLWWRNWLMIVLGVVSVLQVWRAIGEERRRRFYDVTVAQRGRIAAIYFTLLAFLSFETLHSYRLLQLLPPAA